MKRQQFFTRFIVAVILFQQLGCGKLDYENKEFFKQEIYIVSGESTAASERVITAIQAYTFKDTLKIKNDNYDVDLIEDKRNGSVEVKFKVGIGGSLLADRDIPVQLMFDEEVLADYNTENNTKYFIPEVNEYEVNAAFDKVAKLFTVVIPKGSASKSLIFKIPIKREKIEDYLNYAFPLKIVNGGEIANYYNNFMVGNLVVDIDKVVNWSGFPIPELPEGRYHSARLQGNGAENTVGGVHHTYKFITKLSHDQKNKGQFVIWGTGVWSFEVFGIHGSGWMYNKLFLNNEVYGTYTMEPVLQGDPNFPVRTFNYSTTQKSSIDNSYDPKTKTLTLHYKSVIGSDYTDILTYVDDKLDIRNPNASSAPQNWQRIRQLGYKYWLPIDPK
ncbi:hypothetical protein D3C87_519450 [compost metagenome]